MGDLTIDILRLALFSGLILHKLIWEFLKKRSFSRVGFHSSSRKFHIKIIKLGKTLFLLFLAFQTLFLELLPISSQPTLVKAFGSFVFFLGLAIAISGRLQLGDNWVDLEDRQILPGQSIVSRGIYKYVRHPIYTGDLLLLIGLQLALNSWLVLGILALVPIVVAQAVSEETLLCKELQEYNDYCRKTKRFIPFLL
jgi:protein-S-isoprenylcysteine O-methyltransferase Ste14